MYYKILKTLGKVSAILTDSIPQKGVCVEYQKLNHFDYTILIYQNGELKDLSFNGWSFPCVYNNVRFNKSLGVGTNYFYANFEVLDPKGNIHSVEDKYLYGVRDSGIVEYFYTLLYNMSCCESFEQYQQLYKFIYDTNLDDIFNKVNFALDIINFINSFTPRLSKLVDLDYRDGLKHKIETRYKEAQDIIAASKCPTK